MNGHTETAKWLATTFKLTAVDVRSRNNYALRYALTNDHTEVEEWIEELLLAEG